MYYFKYNEKVLCLDGTEETGRIGRLCNHSRKHPNMITKIHILEKKPYLIFISKTDIKKGQELVYDYNEKRAFVLQNNPWLWDS